MNDRKPTVALLLIFVIVFAPIMLMRAFNKTPPVTTATSVAAMDSAKKLSAPTSATTPGSISPTTGTAPAVANAATGAAVVPITAAPLDTIVVHSDLYSYSITNRGAMVSARMRHYKSLADVSKADTIELIPHDAPLLGLRLALGNDTINFSGVDFKPSATSLDVSKAPANLTLTGTSGNYGIELTWHFVPDDYHFDVTGRVTGLGSIGGTLLIDLGNGFEPTEANAAENYRESGVVTKLDKSSLTRFSSLKPGILTPINGPFEWVAIKSKYFVAGLFAYDTSTVDAGKGRIGGVVALAADTNSKPYRAQVHASVSVPPNGGFGYGMYLGPMEYDRLAAMGHDFDDVNPYGFVGLRTVIRPFAVAIRAIFIWAHHSMGLGYGLVIILFGISVRILLWPLNQKAMRSMSAMQAIQPEMTAIQERYKDDPARSQQEMMKLYKDNKVNPFGGCWPMLLPYPLLVSVFFVLQNTIELRGVSFMWFPDLSRFDPIFVTPLLMAASMFALTKIGQRGLPPNPQAKMMMYMMPVVFGVMFGRLASGLNLYYLVQNLASLPQQLLISRERMAMAAAKNGGVSSTGGKVEVKSKR